MKVDELIVYWKSKIHSQHAKMLLAALLNVNSLELLNYLDVVVDGKFEKDSSSGDVSKYTIKFSSKNIIFISLCSCRSFSCFIHSSLHHFKNIQ